MVFDQRQADVRSMTVRGGAARESITNMYNYVGYRLNCAKVVSLLKLFSHAEFYFRVNKTDNIVNKNNR